ncbi:MAG: hypothetical protein EXR77_03390 [Myxococcales bacterium]|nr:hypothetical protein [Myxococcales bacterium]
MDTPLYFGEQPNNSITLRAAIAAAPWRAHVVMRGQLDHDRPRIAVVGSRNASAEQIERATAIGSNLAKLGVMVCSGGARGIDAAALRGALQAQGQVLAVLPCRPQSPYPLAHAALYDAIVAGGGALVCLDEPRALTAHFHRRNRVLAGLADGLIAVAGDVRSGTLQVAREAVRAGDAVAVVPWPIGTPHCEGTRWLAHCGVPTIATQAELSAWLGSVIDPVQYQLIAQQLPAIWHQGGRAHRRSAPGPFDGSAPVGVDGGPRGSPSYANFAGGQRASAPVSAPVSVPVSAPVSVQPVDFATWPAAHQHIWQALHHSAQTAHANGPAGLTLEELVLILDRPSASAAVLHLALGGHAGQAPDGRWQLVSP